MRGGTSKGCMFRLEDLPADRAEWDSIFLQTMGSPDPKQIDGLGSCVSSNNKIVVVWKSKDPRADIEYLVGQVIVGKDQVDYKANCGNMTAAVGPFAVEEGLVDITEPVTTVRLLNRNTDKYINVSVPIDPKTRSFAQDGDCRIAGVDGTAAELRVSFLDPAGSKTGKLLPTGNVLDVLDIPGLGKIEASIIDVSNPLVMVRAEDAGLKGTELPAEINSNAKACGILEKIRGTACVMMGLAKDLEDAYKNQPGVPKVGVFTAPQSFESIDGQQVGAEEMDICARVMSVFKCHKACPLTAANAIAVMSRMEGSIIEKSLNVPRVETVRIGHPSGVMTLIPDIRDEGGRLSVSAVAVQRTARRIMEGTLYIRN